MIVVVYSLFYIMYQIFVTKTTINVFLVYSVYPVNKFDCNQNAKYALMFMPLVSQYNAGVAALLVALHISAFRYLLLSLLLAAM